MSVRMPEVDGAVLARRDAIVAELRAIVPGEGVIAAEREMRPLRKRRTDRLSPAADGGGAAGNDRAGRAGAALLPSTRASRWCRAAPAPRCRAARCRSPTACCSAWPSSTASARSTSTTASPWSSRASPISPSAGRGTCRLLLRARSVLADRLHHRRQRRGEFRRRALPEIRHDHQQRARLRDRADHRRGAAARRQASRRRGLRSAGHRSPAPRACSASSPK